MSVFLDNIYMISLVVRIICLSDHFSVRICLKSYNYIFAFWCDCLLYDVFKNCCMIKKC